MRLSREAWRQLRPLFGSGMLVEFDYHGRRRVGRVETIGEGPRGAFLTLRLENGEYKSFSLPKVERLRLLEAA